MIIIDNKMIILEIEINNKSLMKVNKKASRNENLYVFSHEHHHGLVFSVRLKKASNADTETLKKYIGDFWDNALEDHFKKEEDLFLQWISDKDLKDQFLAEHESINALVNDILNSNNNLVEKVLDLSEQLKLHVKFEEKLLFPWLQNNLSSDQLKSIGDALKHVEVKAHEFEPKFWEI